MRIKQKFLIYPLFFTISISLVGMQVATRRLGASKVALLRYSNLINKSEELDIIRQKFDIKNSPQEIRDISQGKIVIKKEIPLGERYGVCHNYVFTKLMGIVGKAPSLLNITGQAEYYSSEGINILKFFKQVPRSSLQPGDIIVYSSKNVLESINNITHTGIVNGNDSIESKWGPIRAVFEHPTWYVPTVFGDYVYYYRPKKTGNDLFVAVQKRLKKKSVKEKYDVIGRNAQKALFVLINNFEQDPSKDNLHEIYQALEYYMNIQINLPDQNGLTPSMHAERIGCESLQCLLAAYEMMNE